MAAQALGSLFLLASDVDGWPLLSPIQLNVDGAGRKCTEKLRRTGVENRQLL